MVPLFTHIIPSLQTLKILGNTSLFQAWVTKTYDDIDKIELFEGYKYAITCCLNSFIDGIINDEQLGLKSDFLLRCADANLIPIQYLENSCEKTIALKNIKRYYKQVVQAKDYDKLAIAIKEIDAALLQKFNFLTKTAIKIRPGLKVKKETALRFSTINFVHTYLFQIRGHGPIADHKHPISTNWLTQERKELCFPGYKYSMQFLWHQLLGKRKFFQTSLVSLHKAANWNDYKYKKVVSVDSEFSWLLNEREFDINEQESIDSYFFRIQDEITFPLSNRHRITIFRSDTNFYFSIKDYNKRRFWKELLTTIDIKNTPRLSPIEEINKLLYWYSYSIVDLDNSDLYLGIASFNTMLAGTVSLYKKDESEFPVVFVARFVHPLQSEGSKNNYSYGILLDAKSSANHYSSGWVIYKNVCSDYSGFSNAEYSTTEALINKYKSQKKIEVRELVVPLKELSDLTNLRSGEKTTDDIPHSDIDHLTDVLQKARSNFFELFTFYVHYRFYKDQFPDIRWGTDKSHGEKDIIMENDREVILIECKLNGNNCNLEELVQKLKSKLAHTKYSGKNKSIELWFWQELSPQNEELLGKKAIPRVVVSKDKEHRLLRNVDQSGLKKIMNY